MTKKTYGIYGYTTAPIRIPAGDGAAYIQVEFKRGCPNNGGANYRPATYTTSDLAEQTIIENSPMFGRLIKLVAVHEIIDPLHPDAVPVVETPKKETPKVDEDKTKDYPEVVTKEEQLEILKSLGAKATNLVDDEAIRKFMEKKKVTFSNL